MSAQHHTPQQFQNMLSTLTTALYNSIYGVIFTGSLAYEFYLTQTKSSTILSKDITIVTDDTSYMSMAPTPTIQQIPADLGSSPSKQATTTVTPPSLEGDDIWYHLREKEEEKQSPVVVGQKQQPQPEQSKSKETTVVTETKKKVITKKKEKEKRKRKKKKHNKTAKSPGLLSPAQQAEI